MIVKIKILQIIIRYLPLTVITVNEIYISIPIPFLGMFHQRFIRRKRRETWRHKRTLGVA